MDDKCKIMAHRRNNGGFGILGVLLCIAIVCLLVWTIPPPEKHVARVWTVATEKAEEGYGFIGHLLLMPLLAGTASTLELEVLNLGICSVGYSNGNPAAFSFGALGGVIAFAWWK